MAKRMRPEVYENFSKGKGSIPFKKFKKFGKKGKGKKWPQGYGY